VMPAAAAGALCPWTKAARTSTSGRSESCCSCPRHFVCRGRVSLSDQTFQC
jgi:hypothetical protein